MPATEAVPATTSHEDAPLRVAVVVGSVREGRQGRAVADWFLGTAAGHTGLELDVIDLLDVQLPLAMPGWGGAPSLQATAAPADITPRPATADAFVIVTPEYNHSFPASRKNLIDWHHKQWHAKPVGFVSYGGRGGGLRAVEQLRLVFAELHAMTVRDSVSLHGPWSGLAENGTPQRHGRMRGRGQGHAQPTGLVGAVAAGGSRDSALPGLKGASELAATQAVRKGRFRHRHRPPGRSPRHSTAPSPS